MRELDQCVVVGLKFEELAAAAERRRREKEEETAMMKWAGEEGAGLI